MLTSCRQFLNFGATLFMIYKYNRHNINIIMPWQIFPSRIHLKNVLSRWHILKSKSFHPNSDYNENICDKLLVQYFLFFEFFISCIIPYTFCREIPHCEARSRTVQSHAQYEIIKYIWNQIFHRWVSRSSVSCH